METTSPFRDNGFQERLQQVLPSRLYAALARVGLTTPEALRTIRAPEDGLRIKGIGKHHLPILLEALPTLLAPEPPSPPPLNASHLPTAHERTVHELYRRHLSYRAVATALDLTVREVITILERGARLGWWTYTLPTKHRDQTLHLVVPREVLLKTYREHVSTQQVARSLSVSIGTVHRLVQAYGYAPHQLTLMARRHRVSEEVEAMLQQWGRSPTRHELRHHPDWRRISSRIRQLWRTFDGYCAWRDQQDGSFSSFPSTVQPVTTQRQSSS